MSTPSLDIALLVQNQNQGDVTCNAAFTVLDAAANLLATWPTAGADVTLTQDQLASGMVHKLTGALSGDKHLILPASVPRTFVVVNSTTGGHNIIVEVTGVPGSTVTLAAAAGYTLLYSDGTNVIALAASSSGGGSLPTPTSISLAPGAAGNFTIAHTLGSTPKAVTILMTTSGAIWFQSYDSTNLYLVASDPSVTGKALCWA